MKFIKELAEPAIKSSDPYWFIFIGTKLLIHCGDKKKYVIPRFNNPGTLGIPYVRAQYLGRYNDICCFSGEVRDEFELPENMEFFTIFEIYPMLDPDIIRIIFYAIQIVAWDRNFQFCGRCGAKTVNMATERAKKCRKCNLINYPRQSPAVIVAITRGSKLLLARSERFRHIDMYSVLAGFVDPGESLEECVRREVREEVNIEVKNIQYFGSQSWPFPDSLMVGFTAEYESGKISVDKNELVEAKWFSVSELPKIPGKISIARSLIDWFIKKETH
jgi:NAD+ diphosphatase